MTGRALPPTSAFADDDGRADPRLAAALAAHAQAPVPTTMAGVVAALAAARVLVPVLAHLEVGGVTDDGLHVDKEASAGIVALRTPDGRTAMPVFTSVQTLEAWRPDARPVPTEAPRAAASALQEGWDLLVVDPGGPVTLQVPRPAVRAVAAGRQWEPAVVSSPDGPVVSPAVAAAVATALGSVSRVGSARAVPGRSAEVAVVLGVVPGLTRTALDDVLRQVGEALAADEQVTALVDTLELRVVAVAP